MDGMFENVKVTMDKKPTSGSENPVTSDGLFTIIGDIETLLDNIIG